MRPLGLLIITRMIPSWESKREDLAKRTPIQRIQTQVHDVLGGSELCGLGMNQVLRESGCLLSSACPNLRGVERYGKDLKACKSCYVKG